MNFDVSVGGKNGVQVRGENDQFFVGAAAQEAGDVAGFVGGNFEAHGGEKDFHGGGAFCFLKSRRGKFGEARLLVVNPSTMVGEPCQGGEDLRIRGQLRHVCV